MRLSFRPEQERQGQDAPTARHRRRSSDADATHAYRRGNDRSDVVPLSGRSWLRWLLVAGAAGLLVMIVWQLLTMGRIHARGVVRSQVERMLAPAAVTIGGLYVQPGDQVQAGDTLYVLVSEHFQQEADRVQAAIREEELELQSLKQRLTRLQDGPRLEDLQNIQSLRERRNRLQREREQLAVDYDAHSHRLIREIKLLQFQLAQQQAAVEESVEQSTTLNLLAKVDAATDEDIHRQATRERQARERLTATRTRLTQREGELAALERDTRNERERLDRRLTELTRFQSELRDTVAAESERLQQTTANAIERLKARLTARREEYAGYKRRAGPNAIRAGGDGVVVSVAVADDARIGNRSEILELAHTGEVWVDAYVPTAESDAVGPESVVTVRRLEGGEEIEGTCRRSGAVEVPVPAELVALDPGLTRATRMRVDIAGRKHGLNPGNLVELVIIP